MQNVEKGNTIVLSGVESERTYHFQDCSLTFKNPTKLLIQSDNTHVISHENGTDTVEPDWLAFSFKGFYKFNVGSNENVEFTTFEPRTLHVKYELSDEVFNFIIPNAIALYQKESGSLKVVAENNQNYYFTKGFKLTDFLSDS